ncbi:unnamed protein product [Lactuca saligna]|uniref:Serine-threonine/tyrosine-protein kinase catalytic domain-containing protein n=1 Tax=Lactuca saligna TaxID=75948 RepID=A0AA35VCH4_LACSI|nr:unnamed protein product [Lactuca saligna]
MIRSQIPFWRKSMLEAYVDIVFRAWKAANGETREEISWRHMQALVDRSTHEQEYANSTTVNEGIDVYGFSVVLLELVTEKEPQEGDGDMNLAE